MTLFYNSFHQKQRLGRSQFEYKGFYAEKEEVTLLTETVWWWWEGGKGPEFNIPSPPCSVA
jgi:hypothetical protein